MKRTITTLLAALCLTQLQAQTQTQVQQFNLAGPFAVSAPFASDTVSVSGQKFDEASLLSGVSLDAAPAATWNAPTLPSLKDRKSVGVLSFYLNNSDYLKGKIEVKGPRQYKLYIDGKEAGTDLKLAPEHHTLAIKFLAQPSDTDSIRVVIDASRPVTTTLSKAHPYMVHDLTDGRRVRSISLSADGSYVIVAYQTTDRGGKSRWEYELRQLAQSKNATSAPLVRRLASSVTWMPRSSAYLEEATEGDSRNIYKVDAATGERTRWATNVPKGSYAVSPAEDYLIVTAEEEGPKEDAGVFEVVEMDDRQPGWRNRNYLVRHDLASGLSQRITFGSKGHQLADISADGRQLLVVTSYSRLAKRPTEVMDVYLMDAQTLTTDTLLSCEGFLGGCEFSPDGRQILFTGCPEAFGRIGCQLPADVTPNMTENELFIYDIASRQVRPLTKDFDPSVQRVTWSKADGKIYFSAENRDYVHLYSLDPATGSIEQQPVGGDYIYRWDIAAHAPVIAHLAYNTLEPASAYVTKMEKNAKNRAKQWLLFDGKTALGDAQVGTCQDWNFKNSKGDTVYGRLYLPADFDAQKQYPMIVYYYGGCSPVSRYFESPYAPQYWNSLGYVAYIIEPSGATGFGQEWASRHVNTAGRGPADDIIEGVKQICREHPFINSKKIGCMGASYGGFMTQYLQTQTDIFAAAVSHAGIANHTSYWGEGYWGYNYSEVSMANSYPWSHRQLYVDQSPLFNADKIHTPLLLLHGNADTNVPLIESLQMFTALKLLGREVALVEVEGENHHILEYTKREKWLATQMAWFARWLKDDPTWWEALYPKKHL
ncbi:MAG: prolyl oligopeptidase family serine peptidase [Prevotella sp.]|nr:prolyl oligopeptidase family serine peptidase [Prevotella sp.]